MAINIKRYNELKAASDKARREADRAEGAHAQLMARLKKEFHCATVEEAMEELERRRQETTERERKFSEALEEFDQDWSESLKEVGR